MIIHVHSRQADSFGLGLHGRRQDKAALVTVFEKGNLSLQLAGQAAVPTMIGGERRERGVVVARLRDPLFYFSPSFSRRVHYNWICTGDWWDFCMVCGLFWSSSVVVQESE